MTKIELEVSTITHILLMTSCNFDTTHQHEVTLKPYSFFHIPIFLLLLFPSFSAVTRRNIQHFFTFLPAADFDLLVLRCSRCTFLPSTVAFFTEFVKWTEKMARTLYISLLPFSVSFCLFSTLSFSYHSPN